MEDPTSRAPAQDGPAVASDRDRPGSVLIVEDEHLVAADIGRYLQQLHVDVVGPVADGRQAIELAREQRPDMALVDIRIAGLDGLDTAEKLFNHLGIPVIIVTAHLDADYVQRSAQIGVFAYLLKPVTLDDLRVNLAVAWSRYRHQRDLQGQVEHLKTSLENRKLIERAKGLLMDRLGLSEADAMRRLQKKARDSRRSMADLARALLESDELLRTEQARE